MKYLNPFFWYHYYFYETIFVVSVIIFAYQYYRGSTQNRRIANIHLKQIANELSKYFKNVGNNDCLFEADNSHTYKLYASNHQIMKFGLVALYVNVIAIQLNKRENFFFQYGYQILFRTKEKIVIEIGVQPSFRQFICFGVVKQNQIKKIKKEGYEDLKNICHAITIPELNQSLQVLTEFDEVAQQICSPDIINLLNANEKSIYIIYISDVDRDPACKICVKIMTLLQPNADYGNLIQLATELALKISSIKMDLKVNSQILLENKQSRLGKKKVQLQIQGLIYIIIMNEQNWAKGNLYQDYFDFVILITEKRNDNQIAELSLSLFDCVAMHYSYEYIFDQVIPFDEMMKSIDQILFEILIQSQKSFIFCTYGKDLFLRLIPSLAVKYSMKPQSYYLQFIDLRNELFNYMLTTHPEVHNQLSDLDDLFPLMMQKLKLSHTPQFHQQLKDLIEILHNQNHKFGIPVIINPQNIYGLKYYMREPWFNQVKQKEQFFVKIRGIPFQCTQLDLMTFLDISTLIKENVAMKYLQNGQFSGEAMICVSKEQLEEIKQFHKAQMDHRYIEILNSTFDEFQEAKQSISSMTPEVGSDKGILKLRGLPWTCSEGDVRNFLQSKNSIILDSSKIKSIKLLFDNTGKAKGQCFVVLKNLEAAEKLKQQFHNKSLGKRYIEVIVPIIRYSQVHQKNIRVQ